MFHVRCHDNNNTNDGKTLQWTVDIVDCYVLVAKRHSKCVEITGFHDWWN